jgi:anti-sigma regulatory factor (Ser/Thr protein kinase)
MNVPRGPSASSFASEELHKRLRGSLDAERLESLKAVIWELVDNAVVHGRGTIRMHVVLDGDELRGVVSDEGDSFARPAAAAGGLARVESHVTRWGVSEDGARVWFEVCLNERAERVRVQLHRDERLAGTPPRHGSERGPVVPRQHSA